VSWADIQFVQSLVQSVPSLASSSYLTVAPKQAVGQPPAAYPYALIHSAGGTDTQGRVAGPASTEHPEFTIHLVGESAEQCQALVDLVKAKVIVGGFGIIPTVTGRSNKRMYWRMPIPIQTNTDVTPVLCYAVVEVGWVSEPSS
jgi:hypothetical protein